MRVLTAAALFALFAAPAARAGSVEQCRDEFTECQDDCSVQFGGSIREAMKKKLLKCMKKCTKKGSACHERVTETATNHLDDGALDHSPGSAEVDEHGLPDRTSARDDEAPASEEPKPKSGKNAKRGKPKDELRDEEVVKSSRTSLGPAPETSQPSPDPAPVQKEAREEPQVIELKAERRGREEELRDDATRPASKKKSRESAGPKETPRPKDEDRDDLRNF